VSGLRLAAAAGAGDVMAYQATSNRAGGHRGGAFTARQNASSGCICYASSRIERPRGVDQRRGEMRRGDDERRFGTSLTAALRSAILRSESARRARNVLRLRESRVVSSVCIVRFNARCAPSMFAEKAHIVVARVRQSKSPSGRWTARAWRLFPGHRLRAIEQHNMTRILLIAC